MKEEKSETFVRYEQRMFYGPFFLHSSVLNITFKTTNIRFGRIGGHTEARSATTQLHKWYITQPCP